ncbi:VOC family protein [Streptomyces sp. NPDC093252]|uniref:VOC family protein n=1 Tax=Streptomyces sp. NPDC093252 TaxID=3154980 RepID=UPI003421154D
MATLSTPSTPSTPSTASTPTAPAKLSHVVLQTNRLPQMRDWYCDVLGAHPAYDNGRLAFLAYDDEHHRVGIISLDDYAERDTPVVGLQHFSFTYDTLEVLLATYERLKADGIRPVWTVNHGPTVSFYYADPDGNHVELQVDVFATTEETDAYMNSAAYQTNPRGVDIDPEDLLARLRAGESVASLTARGN